MKIIRTLFLAALACFSPLTFADAAAEMEAEKLLNTMGMETALQQSMSQMLDIQLQQNPALTPYRSVLMEFFNKYVSYESLKPEMLTMYANAFTADELKQINAFYATDAGKKTIEKMPILMAQGAQIGAQRVQENIGELQAMIEAEAQRIEELQEIQEQ
jgi:hypothetical protein